MRVELCEVDWERGGNVNSVLAILCAAMPDDRGLNGAAQFQLQVIRKSART
jgi:hypothetical protein